MLWLILAQISADPSATAQTDQDRVTAAEMRTYADWRTCVLKVAHRRSRKIRNHAAVADAALQACTEKAAGYVAAVTALARLYRLRDPEDFGRRNGHEAEKTLSDLVMKELQ